MVIAFEITLGICIIITFMINKIDNTRSSIKVLLNWAIE